MTPLSAAETRQALVDLLARSTPENTSDRFRATVHKAVCQLDSGDETGAATTINFAAAHTGGLHDCAAFPHVEPESCLQADEDATEAYTTLSDLRFRFGYLTMRRRPSNIMVLVATPGGIAIEADE
jgi:hypothetical protein